MYFLAIWVLAHLSMTAAVTSAAEIQEHWKEEVKLLRDKAHFHKLPKYAPLVEQSPLKLIAHLDEYENADASLD